MAFLTLAPVRAATIDWADTGTAWATGSNWISNNPPADDLTTDTARFVDAVFSFQPQVSGARNVSGLQFGDGLTATGNLTLSGAVTPLLGVGANGISVAPLSGTVTISAPVRLGMSQNWTNNSSNLLTISGAVSNIADGAPFALTINGSGSGGTRISGVISDGGATGTVALHINSSGTGVTTLSNLSNSFTGGVTLSQGILRASQSGASGNVLGSAGTLTLAGGELQLVRPSSTSASNFARNTVVTGNVQITSEAGSTGGGVTHSLGTLSIGANTMSIAAGASVASGTAGITFGATTLMGNATFDIASNARLNLGTVDDGSGSFGITKNGQGYLNLSGGGTVEGVLAITEGTLNVGGTGASLGGVIVGSVGGSAAATFSLSSLGGGGGAIITGGAIQITSGSGSRTLSFAGSGSNQSQNLSNAIVLANDLAINSNMTGTNVANTLSGGVSGSGNVIVTNTGNTVSFSGTGLNFTGSLTNSGSGTVALNSAVGSNIIHLTHNGSGTLVLGAANSSYTNGVTVDAGTLRMGNANALNAANTVAVGLGATFDMKAVNTTSFDQTIAGLSNGTGGGGTVTNTSGTARTLTLAGAGNYTFGGTLMATTATNMRIAKTGSGTQTFTGNNTYGGTTTISGGRMLVNGTHTGAGTYLVNAGGTLGGIGSIIGALNSNITLASGAKLAPGASAGTLTADLSGTLNISAAVGGANVEALEFELGIAGAGSSDTFVLTNGTLMIGAGNLEFSDFDFTQLGGFGAGTYTLFDTNSAINGTLGLSLSGTLDGYNGIIGIDGNDLVLTVTAIPEPSVSMVLLGGIGMLLAFSGGRRAIRGGKI